MHKEVDHTLHAANRAAHRVARAALAERSFSRKMTDMVGECDSNAEVQVLLATFEADGQRHIREIDDALDEYKAIVDATP